MTFLLLLSIATLFAGSSAVETTNNDNRQLQWNPNCGTLALWHPDYTTGWGGGYCTLQTTCNSPSYSTAAECCNAAYAGQSSNTCYTTAGIPAPTPAPVAPVPGVPAAGTWYPDYNAGWDAGECINTLPLPPYGSRPLYATQLECCKLAYAGQANNFCIANMVNPPTANPTVSPTSSPSKAPTTASPSKAPTTKTPTTASPSKAPTTKTPTIAPTVAPTKTPTIAPTVAPTKTPTVAPTSSPSKAPTTASPSMAPTTGTPTVTQYGSLWYPKYDVAGTCTAKLPLPPPGSRSYFASKDECCLGTYATWGSTKATDCISGSTV